MDWKGFGNMRLWSNLRYYPGICLKDTKKTTKELSQDSRFPDQDLNPGPPECEPGMLTTYPQSSVPTIFCTRRQISVVCSDLALISCSFSSVSTRFYCWVLYNTLKTSAIISLTALAKSSL
jgi:hypothetical protein